MATTQEIIDAAVQLGKLIATHQAAIGFDDTVKQFKDDVEAQRLMTDYQRHLAKISEKESKGEPIEVEDKRQIEKFQGEVIRHPVLRDLQIKQMDYLDLMRRVDEAIASRSAPGGAAAGSSLGDLAGEGQPPAGGTPLS